MNGKLVTLAVVMVVALQLLHTTSALGHVSYDHSTPGSGERVTNPLTRVDIWFSGTLLGSGTNTINVLNPNGVDIDHNDTTLDNVDHKHMYITLQGGLIYGNYTVQWTATASDGHESSGSFMFNFSSTVGGVARLANLSAGQAATAGGSRSAVIWGAAAALALVVAVSGAWWVRRAPR